MKHFYTDALAAAWQSKHFGMKFSGVMENNAILTHKDGSPLASRYIEILDYPKATKFIIHPDSLYLLEPNDDDVGIDDGGFFCCYFGEWLLDGHEGEPSLPVEIIRRNQLPFMSPECEE